MKWPFVRTSTYEKAAGNAEYALDQLVGTRIVNDCLTDANLAVARRLTRALRACARYRAAATAEKQRADHLQARFDDLLGLNDPAITAGETWQDRREQKMRYDK
jgi:hypothetical protein